MKRVLLAIAGLACVAYSQDWYVTGSVTMEDGSPPPKRVSIERYCGEGKVIREGITDARGAYILRNLSAVMRAAEEYSWAGTGTTISPRLGGCVLRASLSGYHSSTIDLTGRRSVDDPHLPPLVLSRERPESTFRTDAAITLPKTVRKNWEQAMRAAQRKNWAEAERLLRTALDTEPRFAEGWRLLGIACQNQHRLEPAREALRRLVKLKPREVTAYALLSPLDIDARDWRAAVRSADALIRLDTKRRYPEAHLYLAIARYQLRDLDAAEASVKEVLRLDSGGRMPRAHWVLGLIQEARRDYPAAAQSLRRYLELQPKAADAGAIQARIAKLGTPGGPGQLPELGAADLVLAPAAEAWVPGGMGALARAARMEAGPSPQAFFTEYCRAIVRHSGYPEGLRHYFIALAELAQLGKRREDRIEITLSLATPGERRDAARVLGLFGWKLVEDAGATSIEPGDTAADGPRQRLPAALGVDEIALQQALLGGRTFTFFIASESAPLTGGDVWTQFAGPGALPSGGVAEIFARQPNVARVSAALGTVGADTARSIVSGVGLRSLVERHALALHSYGSAFALEGNAVAVPGGPAAEPVWAELAGTSPRDPPAFFRALLEKDLNRLVAFYFALSQCNAAHQRFYLKSAAHARQFMDWRASHLNDLPLSESGAVHFPGGRGTWSQAASDEGALAGLGSPEALIEIARVERARKAPFDEASVVLLARHFEECRHAYPYFARLPGLGFSDFEAFFAFIDKVRDLRPALRDRVMGLWHALVELICVANRPELFRRVCESGDAREVMHALLRGAPDPDAAVRRDLLRLEGRRLEAFEQILAQQLVPRLAAAATGDDLLAALTGIVYALRISPDNLLVSEDPLLVRKHRFTDTGALFPPAELVTSSQPPGTYVRGGFAEFEAVARRLAPAGGASPPQAEPGARPALPRPDLGPVTGGAEIFRAEARLVEIHATVTDGKGRYIDGLGLQDFTVLEEGQAQQVKAFEAQAADLSCALVLDSTGSMYAALPALKSAALKLIGELRAGDSVAVYSFNQTLAQFQPFTTDKGAARRAVLRAFPNGETALYDALAQVSREMSGRSGKKVIVVFTDGADNVSLLGAGAAVRRAKMLGAPVYAIAQGAALESPVLLSQLESVSNSTGGLSFAIRNAGQIRTVFESVAADLKHGYLLAYQPQPSESREWRRIQVLLRESKDLKVRAREGYYPE